MKYWICGILFYFTRRASVCRNMGNLSCVEMSLSYTNSCYRTFWKDHPCIQYHCYDFECITMRECNFEIKWNMTFEMKWGTWHVLENCKKIRAWPLLWHVINWKIRNARFDYENEHEKSWKSWGLIYSVGFAQNGQVWHCSTYDWCSGTLVSSRSNLEYEVEIEIRITT